MIRTSPGDGVVDLFGQVSPPIEIEMVATFEGHSGYLVDHGVYTLESGKS